VGVLLALLDPIRELRTCLCCSSLRAFEGGGGRVRSTSTGTFGRFGEEESESSEE
jgi:hypothetical protein